MSMTSSRDSSSEENESLKSIALFAVAVSQFFFRTYNILFREPVDVVQPGIASILNSHNREKKEEKKKEEEEEEEEGKNKK